MRLPRCHPPLFFFEFAKKICGTSKLISCSISMRPMVGQYKHLLPPVFVLYYGFMNPPPHGRVKQEVSSKAGYPQ